MVPEFRYRQTGTEGNQARGRVYRYPKIRGMHRSSVSPVKPKKEWNRVASEPLDQTLAPKTLYQFMQEYFHQSMGEAWVRHG